MSMFVSVDVLFVRFIDSLRWLFLQSVGSFYAVSSFCAVDERSRQPRGVYRDVGGDAWIHAQGKSASVRWNLS